MRGLRLLTAVAVLSALLVGCRESDDEGSAAAGRGRFAAKRRLQEKLPWETYVERMGQASDDEERWALTLAHFWETPGGRLRGRESARYQIRRSVWRLGEFADCWAAKFPGVTKHVVLTLPELERLGEGLEPGFWAKVENDISVISARLTPDMRAEISRAWLKIVTGRGFASRSEFRAWLDENREALKWNRELGRFVKLRALSRPESGGNAVDSHRPGAPMRRPM